MGWLITRRLDGDIRAPTDLYFIQSECAEKFIKIGIACDVASRLRQLQIACPYPLTVLKVVKDSAHMERDLHRRFDSDRVTGEWFRRSSALLEVIDGLQGFVEDPPPQLERMMPMVPIEDKREDAICEKAHELWQERERRFPPFVRRDQPDKTDIQTGVWDIIYAMATEIIDGRDQSTIYEVP